MTSLVNKTLAREIDRYKNFISDKKNIKYNYNCKAKCILHNT